jgi:pimeloyl-ACP methyl ester carboxylesterase
MPFLDVNGVSLYYEESGSIGSPIVFVHGAWVNHKRWDAVVPRFAETYKVVTYDRRGHSQSDAPPGQGSIREDVGDLIGLIDSLAMAPAHVVANSSGANIALRAAATHPDVVRGLAIHEPPALALLEGDDRFNDQLDTARQNLGMVVKQVVEGDHEGAAKLFAERVAFGPGSWERLPGEVREMFIENAPTFVDEVSDPEAVKLPVSELEEFTKPVLMTQGDRSPPFFSGVTAKLEEVLPQARTYTFEGDGHVPHTTNPDAFAAAVIEFLDGVEQSTPGA